MLKLRGKILYFIIPYKDNMEICVSKDRVFLRANSFIVEMVITSFFNYHFFCLVSGQ